MNRKMITLLRSLGVIIISVASIAKNDLLPLPVPMTIAHCATLNRFVIKETQKAMEASDINQV